MTYDLHKMPEYYDYIDRYTVWLKRRGDQLLYTVFNTAAPKIQIAKLRKAAWVKAAELAMPIEVKYSIVPEDQDKYFASWAYCFKDATTRIYYGSFKLRMPDGKAITARCYLNYD